MFKVTQRVVEAEGRRRLGRGTFLTGAMLHFWLANEEVRQNLGGRSDSMDKGMDKWVAVLQDR